MNASATVRELYTNPLADGTVNTVSITREGAVRIEKFWRLAEFDEYLRGVITDVVRAVLAERTAS